MNVYYPKPLVRFGPKSDATLNLRSLSLDATLKLLLTSNQAERNAREKKQVRKYLAENVPREVQKDILARSLEKWIGTDRVLKLVDHFEPSLMITDKIDLLGPFRYAYGCYYSNNRLFWSNGTIERLNLTDKQCELLYNIWNWGETKTIQTLSLSSHRTALGNSRIPHILARSPMLTSVTILNGTTNHVLRILGLHCPHLFFLDISHSQGVTDDGLYGLIFRYPNKRNQNNEMNRCARSIKRIITIGTNVTKDGLEKSCFAFDFAYGVAFLPDTMIFRPDFQSNRMLGLQIEIDSSAAPLWQLKLDDKETRAVELTLRRFTERRRGTENTPQSVDFFQKGQSSQIFIRPTDSYLAQAVLGIKERNITELILTWDSFTWSVTNLPDLTELALAFPNLKVLKARIQGTWDRNDTLFPYLTETFVWTVADSTVLSFLQHCPSIKTFKFNCLDLERLPHRMILDDHNLRIALTKNIPLRKNLVEVSIRPATHLTSLSVMWLIENCPNLKRLGDLESWSITTELIKVCNALLDRINSQCVLTVLSFPPKKSPEFLL